MSNLQVRVINPDEIVFEGEADYVLAPGVKGMLGIMPSHTPYFGELLKGTIIIQGKEEKTFEIESGLIKVRADEVTLLIGI